MSHPATNYGAAAAAAADALKDVLEVAEVKRERRVGDAARLRLLHRPDLIPGIRKRLTRVTVKYSIETHAAIKCRIHPFIDCSISLNYYGPGRKRRDGRSTGRNINRDRCQEVNEKQKEAAEREHSGGGDGPNPK